MFVPDNIYEPAEHLLSRVAPAVADRLRQKFYDDHKAFTQAATEAQPSSDPKYWAKSACTRCNGTGVSGKLVSHKDASLAGSDVACSCTYKNYYKWLKSFRQEYNKKRDNNDST